MDLRTHSVDEILEQAEGRLDLRVDRRTLVRKRRSVGSASSRGTWVRIEFRPLTTLAAHGQMGNGVEAASLLSGIAKPAWHRAASWVDPEKRAVWRVDEVDLVTAWPVRHSGRLEDVSLTNNWWETLNTSLANLVEQHTTRIATPDTVPISQELVASEIRQAFPGDVDASIPAHRWVPAHADLNWANLTSPECWILDWEDHGLAPAGLDSATLWASSLSAPPLADRVYRERQHDLDTHSGRVMALFHCAKILNDSTIPATLRDTVTREAHRLLAELN